MPFLAAEMRHPNNPRSVIGLKPRIRGDKITTTLKIDDTLKGRVQYLAALRCRENFKQEALASWAAYKETGRHLTGQEIRAWLNTWGTDDERAVPECHE